MVSGIANTDTFICIQLDSNTKNYLTPIVVFGTVVIY